MAFATSILDNSIKKNTLVILRPRVRRKSEWALYSANVYRIAFDFGYVTRMFSTYPSGELDAVSSLGSIANNKYYQDFDAGYLYIGSNADPTLTGRTIEFELNISSDAFTGPRDPLDSTSRVVDWVPALLDSPMAKNGSRDSVVGFNPLNSSAIKILNHDGWMNEFLHEASFNVSLCKGFVMCGDDYDYAITNSDISEIFFGYGNGLSIFDETVNVSVTDFFSFLDRRVPLANFSSFSATTLPDVGSSGSPYRLRRLLGFSDRITPINIDYDDSPTTANNRIFLTHQDLGDDLGTVTYTIDTGGANSATRTYTNETPQLRVGDRMRLVCNGASYYVVVSSCNPAGKFFDHTSIVRTVTGADTAERPYIQYVDIIVDDAPQNLYPYRDFTLYSTTFGGVTAVGFQLVNNFEAGFAAFGGLPFNPDTQPILCGVYGKKELPLLSDNTTEVGETTDEGGVAAKASSILYTLLLEAGVEQDLIDEDSFTSLSTDHSLGVLYPLSASSGSPTFKSVIQQVLSSMIWKLAFIQTNNRVKIGVVEVGPFVSTGDYEIDDTEFSQISYEHDYADIYYEARCQYAINENGFTSNQQNAYVNSYNTLARDLHFFQEETIDLQIYQYITSEAQVIADRYAFLFGDRRGIYQMVSTSRSVLEGNLGASIDIYRESLPGFALTRGTLQTRQLQTIEVQKSASGARLVLEDQKGIQDNSGDW